MKNILTLLLLMSALWGCATVPNASIENMTGEIPAGHGFVVAESLNNSTRITGPIQRWTEIVLWRQSEEESDKDNTFTINALSHSYSTQAYFGSVPAGTYRIGMLYAFLQGYEISYSARALFPPDIGTFEVRPGQVTNLGSMLYQPFQARSWTDESYPDYAITRVPNDRLWASTAAALPKIAAKIDSSLPILGWQPDEFDESRNEAARLMKTVALPTKMHAVKDGFLLSGLYGGLYSSRGGQWRNHSIDSPYLITDVAELPDGRLLIGGEMGSLSLSGPLGENRRDLSFDTKLENVLDIDLSDSGTAYVVTARSDQYNIYRFDSKLDKVDQIKQLPKQVRGFLADAYGIGTSHPVLLGHENGIVVYIDKKMHRYDEAGQEWATTDAVEFNSLNRQLDGTILGTPYSSWSGAKPLNISTDDGKGWQQISEKRGVFTTGTNVPTYRFADGELLRTGKGDKFKLFSGWKANESVPVLSTTNMGEEWESVGSVPYGCENLAVEASSDSKLYILCIDGGVFASDDRGRNWQESLEPRIPVFEEFPVNLKVKFKREE